MGLNDNQWFTRGVTTAHEIGRYVATNSYYYNGYMTDVMVLDAVAVSVTDFGEFNNQGVWVPKTYNGIYGTNGFHLDYADNTNYGNDVSGNNNDFTDPGLATNDQVPDTPTNNYSTLNSIDRDGTYPAFLSEGNLFINSTASGDRPSKATIAYPLSGKWY